jgi:hypothetical protein
MSREVALVSFGFYIALVWLTAGLAIRDWLTHYMKEDPAFGRFYISDEGKRISY